MKVLKWNFKLQDYEPYDVPSSWKLRIREDNMNARCNCARCGADFRYGDMYDSRIIHNEYHMPYAICKECINIERDIESKYAESNRPIMSHLSLMCKNDFQFNRMIELLDKQSSGEIQGLRINPKFTLRDDYVCPNGELVQEISYRVDFYYAEKSIDNTTSKWCNIIDYKPVVELVDPELPDSHYDSWAEDFKHYRHIHLRILRSTNT